MSIIKGIGIDIVKSERIARIKNLHEAGFIRKVLHIKEIEEYKTLSIDKSKTLYLSSRWAVKEALVKATGNRSIIFSSVLINKDNTGKPYLTMTDNNEFDKSKFQISISHEDDYSTAVVLYYEDKI